MAISRSQRPLFRPSDHWQYAPLDDSPKYDGVTKFLLFLIIVVVLVFVVTTCQEYLSIRTTGPCVSAQIHKVAINLQLSESLYTSIREDASTHHSSSQEPDTNMGPRANERERHHVVHREGVSIPIPMEVLRNMADLHPDDTVKFIYKDKNRNSMTQVFEVTTVIKSTPTSPAARDGRGQGYGGSLAGRTASRMPGRGRGKIIICHMDTWRTAGAMDTRNSYAEFTKSIGKMRAITIRHVGFNRVTGATEPMWIGLKQQDHDCQCFEEQLKAAGESSDAATCWHTEFFETSIDKKRATSIRHIRYNGSTGATEPTWVGLRMQGHNYQGCGEVLHHRRDT